MTPDAADGRPFPAAFLAAIGAALPEIVVLGDDIPERNWHDWSEFAPVKPAALLRPRDASDIAIALKLANQHGAAIVPQGGLTGISGGAHPLVNSVVLSLERLNGIEIIDPIMATMTVKAGTPLQAVQQAADDAGLFVGIDLGARGSCQIGGNVSTNAGGNRVIRYGMARDSVLGLEVVLPDGTIVSSLNTMIKNNAGYDLKHLFIGSEGTLGIITRVVLRLQAKPLAQTTMFCGCRDFAAVLDLLAAMRARLGPGLSAFEVMWPSFYDFMTRGLPHLRRPFSEPHGVYVLVEASSFDPAGDQARLEAAMADLLDSGALSDAVLANSEKDTRDLWAVRDSVSEYGKLMGPLNAYDVGVPLDRMEAVEGKIAHAMAERWPDAIVLSYGHIGDSNLHIVSNIPSAGAHQPHDDVTDVVLGIVREAGGTVSAEHGIGLAKRSYLHYSRTPEELALMRLLKRTLDPNAILNPGKVFTV